MISMNKNNKKDRANKHCQGIACATSFYIDLTSAEGQTSVCLKNIKYVFN